MRVHSTPVVIPKRAALDRPEAVPDRRDCNVLRGMRGSPSCPTLVVFSTDSPYRSDPDLVEAPLRGRRNVTVRWVESGHCFHWEQPALAAEMIDRFVEDAGA